MCPVVPEFQYPYRGCDVVYGRGRIDRLGELLERRGLDRSLLVCGSSVGANDDLVGPIRDGLGERLVGVYDGSSPDKAAESAFGAIEAAEDVNADVLIGVGGGSSLDVTRQASAFASDDRSLADLRREAERNGRVRPPGPENDRPAGSRSENDRPAGSRSENDRPAGNRPAVVVVPTTFAGADLADGGSIEVLPAADSPTGQPVTVSGSVTPIADVADPDLFETTPADVLAGSAMNGVDKGVETPYARDANPVSDATALHGLRLLSEGLPRCIDRDSGTSVGGDGITGRDAMERAVVGSLLVQLDRKLSIVHAVGHGFARRYAVQQGTVHAVVVPHVLRYLFEQVDGSRRLLAEGFGIDPTGRTDAEVAEAVVGAVIDLRDSLGVPTRLRDLPETRRGDLSAVAAFVVEDPLVENVPEGLEPTRDEIEQVLNAVW